MEADNIAVALQACLEPIAHMETTWAPDELLKRMHKYFVNAVKQVEFTTGLQECVDAYCDQLFSTICTALNDRPWVGQVNWIPVVQVALQELFPPEAFMNVPAEVLNVNVVSSAERAFEASRFWYATDFDTALQMIAEGKSSKQKIFAALEAGRKEAWDTARTSGEEFLKALIASTIRNLTAEAGGNPNTVLPEPGAAEFFGCLVASGALPQSGDIGQEAPRDDWSAIINPAVQDAYSGFEQVEVLLVRDTGGVAGGAKKKRKSKSSSSWGEEQGYDMYGGAQGYNPYGGKGNPMMGMGNPMMAMMGGMKGGGMKGGGQDMEAMMNQMMGMMGMMSQMSGMMGGGKGGMMGGKGGW